jgi:hypothetical protein
VRTRVLELDPLPPSPACLPGPRPGAPAPSCRNGGTAPDWSPELRPARAACRGMLSVGLTRGGTTPGPTRRRGRPVRTARPPGHRCGERGNNPARPGGGVRRFVGSFPSTVRRSPRRGMLPYRLVPEALSGTSAHQAVLYSPAARRGRGIPAGPSTMSPSTERLPRVAVASWFQTPSGPEALNGSDARTGRPAGMPTSSRSFPATHWATGAADHTGYRPGAPQ